MHDGDTPQDATARGAYTDQVTQLVAAHRAVLFDLVTAAAQCAATGAEPIAVTRTAQALTASVGAQAATFQVEAITDHPADLSRAQTYLTGQARCLLPQPDGTTDAWVLALQHVGSGDRGARHIWIDARTQQPVDEAAVAAQLASLSTLAEPPPVGGAGR